MLAGALAIIADSRTSAPLAAIDWSDRYHALCVLVITAVAIAAYQRLGFLIGIIPGSAHIISSFMSYALERRLSRRPDEFGQGAVAGVAGPESANNAASTGAFVPMLALGLPTGPVIAVLMAALLIHGVPPGPTLVNDHPNVFWGFVASMYVGNLMLPALNLPLVGLFVNLLRIPYGGEDCRVQASRTEANRRYPASLTPTAVPCRGPGTVPRRTRRSR